MPSYANQLGLGSLAAGILSGFAQGRQNAAKQAQEAEDRKFKQQMMKMQVDAMKAKNEQDRLKFEAEQADREQKQYWREQLGLAAPSASSSPLSMPEQSRFSENFSTPAAQGINDAWQQPRTPNKDLLTMMSNPLGAAMLKDITGIDFMGAANLAQSQRATNLADEDRDLRLNFDVLKQNQEFGLKFDQFQYQKEQDRLAKGEKATKEAIQKESTDRSGNIIIQDLGRALDIISTNPAMTTGLASFSSVVPESPAGKANALIEGVKSIISLDTLNRMRQNSPTGSSGFGNLSEKEGERLASAFGNINLRQDKSILIPNIQRAINLFMDTVYGNHEYIKNQYKEGKIDKATSDALSFRYNLSFDNKQTPSMDSFKRINLPKEAVSKLKEGEVTTFGNGQKWTLKNGVPVQVQ